MNTITKRYGGIGPRKTPLTVLPIMSDIASQLAGSQWLLRSGHGKGADQAFGVGAPTDKKEIWLPEFGFNNAPHYDCYRRTPCTEKVIKIARDHHIKYDIMRPAYQRLMDCNVNIILGEHADSPVDMVIYWQSEEGAADYFGGTNHSLRIAKTYAIPTFNIRLDNELEALAAFVNERDAA